MEIAEETKPWQRYLGIFWACYCGFGGTLIKLIIQSVPALSTNQIVSGIMSNMYIIPYILLLVSFVPVIFKPLKQQKAKKIILWSMIISFLYIVFSFFMGALESVLFRYFFGQSVPHNSNDEDLLSNLHSPDKLTSILFIILVCVIGPLIEEISYRICLFGTLRKKHRILSHLITALLFGFQHVSTAVILSNRPQEILYIFSYMGFSLLMTIMYKKLKTPVPGIIAHMLCNTIGIFTSH